MLLKTWTKGVLILFALLFLSSWAFQMEAWARAGGGRSIGSRGSRSMTAPRPSQPSSTYTPTRPSTPPLGAPGAQPSSGGFWRSMGGGILGGLAGGMLFQSLFGGPAAHGSGTVAGGGGGIGLMDILLLAGIAYLIYWYIKKKRREAGATAGAGYYQSQGSGTLEMPPQPQYPPLYEQSQAAALEGNRDLDQGLANIRQFDPSFDEARFQDMGMDTFFKIQGAWANRDMVPVKNLLTDEMYRTFQQEADQLKTRKQINRLENIAVRSVDITEAWQESGSDFITVRVYANLLDYNVDEITGQVLSGSKTEPVKFQEYWTFTRSVGNNPWQLAAISQAT